MDAIKIKALRDLGIDEATIQKLLEDVEQTEKAAVLEGVRYKGSVAARESEIAEVLTGAIGAVEDRVWHEYERGNFRGAIDMTSRLVTTTKASLDPRAACDAAFDALRAASGDGAAANWLKDKVQALAAPVGAAGSKVADSGPMSATKAGRVDVFAAALMGDLQSDGRPR